jgi:predicted Zn finger-like uncharacterized protein
MIIQCDQCKTKFRLDDSRVTETGVRVRCSRCKHTFIVKKEASEEEADFDTILQSFGDSQTDKKGGSVDVGFASSATQEAVQSAESISVPNVSASESTTCRRGENPPEETAKDLGFGKIGSGFSAGEDFDFDDFSLADDTAETKADFLHFPNLHGYADKNAEDTAFAGEFGKNGPACSDIIESLSEPSWQPQLEKDLMGSGIFEEEEVAVGLTDTEKAEEAECIPCDAHKDTFADVEPEVNEESTIFPAGNEGELSVTVGDEQLPAPSAEDTQELKAPPLGEFAGVVNDELPPLSITSRRKGGAIVSIALTVAALLIVLALTATGFYFVKSYSGKSTLEGLGSLTNWFKRNVDAGGEMEIKNLEGSFLVNNEAGEIFVVRGEAFNNSKKPRTAVRVKAVIYGANGKILAEKLAYCGNILSNDQLITFPMGTIEKSLDNQSGDSLNNLVVQPGKGIPFTIVFRNTPQGAGEFGAGILGSAVAAP